MSDLTEKEYSILSAVQSIYLTGNNLAYSVEKITDYVEKVLMLSPHKEEVNKQSIVDELIRRNSIWTGESKVLYSTEGHQDWLNADRKVGWEYWPRYKTYLAKQIAQSVADDVDVVTDRILGLLEDPARHAAWDRRGLVVGHVQSGKTSNYTGLICKAADAGYRIIIVLAGMTNSLRTQTQIRLEEGFLGYITTPRDSDDLIWTGVGLQERNTAIRPNHVTNRLQNGDFNLKVAKHLGISPEQRPWLFVVKKNKSILNSIHKWLKNYVADYDAGDGEKLITKVPLLLIDDESDNASVDTARNVMRDDGTPDDEHDPKAINKGIRRILKIFSRSAYVGYTATPFANIFIHDEGETRREGKDLFPESFIINLAASSEYFGPVRLFKAQRIGEQELSLADYLANPITDVPESGGWMPAKHKKIHVPTSERESRMPQSLEDAILAFFLVCAVRRLRGQKNKHSSMLVHVSRFMDVQRIVFERISAYVQYCHNRIMRNEESVELIEQIHVVWKTEFVEKQGRLQEILNIDDSLPLWTDIVAELPYVLGDLSVMLLNGQSSDVLEYDEHKNTGLKVIAIGGDKLSRGLTLEGLSISYFLRGTNMYDTLMQMGRWFGYRRGYLDLCRLYTTKELIRWFEQITDATEKLRTEFDLMEEQKLTPKDYGLRVQHYPDMQITSRDKSRATRELSLNFEGQRVQTIVFHKAEEILRKNYQTTVALFGSLGAPDAVNPALRTEGGFSQWEGALWRDVKASSIIDYLAGYITHESATRVSSRALIEFIQTMNADGYLNSWSVGLIGASETGASSRVFYELGEGLTIPSMRRSDIGKDLPDRYSIKVLTSPRDETIDFNESFYKEAYDLSVRIKTNDSARIGSANREELKIPSLSGEAVRTIRARHRGSSIDRGLLNIYVLDSSSLDVSTDLPIIGFAISIPDYRSGNTVKYKVNHVFTELWEYEDEP
jgi:hypothetical protein